jgi:hypothetical protein
MERQGRGFTFAVVLLLASGFAAGCADMTPAQQRALSGGAIGAAGGALIGAATGGNAGAGAAIGGAAGAAGGYLYEKNQESKSHYPYGR